MLENGLKSFFRFHDVYKICTCKNSLIRKCVYLYITYIISISFLLTLLVLLSITKRKLSTRYITKYKTPNFPLLLQHPKRKIDLGDAADLTTE